MRVRRRENRHAAELQQVHPVLDELGEGWGVSGRGRQGGRDRCAPEDELHGVRVSIDQGFHGNDQQRNMGVSDW